MSAEPAINRGTPFSGYVNEALGSSGVIVESKSSTASTFTSVVTIGTGTTTLQVTHDYQPSVTENLYEIKITVENIGADSLTNLKYR